MSWGFLQKHRMFHADISSIPGGYRIELRVAGGKPIAVTEGRSVDRTMRLAAWIAENKLNAEGEVLRKRAKARLARRLKRFQAR
jgi:hypothetical protein